MDKEKQFQELDSILAQYFASLKDAIEANKLDLSKLPAPQVTVPDIKIPDIPAPEMPEIVIPEIKIPDITIPPIVVPKPEVTVNVDRVRIENFPEFPEPERFDDSEILKALRKLLEAQGGGGGGPTEYKSGDGYSTIGLFGTAPLWDDAGTLRGISATYPLPMTGTIGLSSVADTPETFEDTSFVTGDSPATLDCNAALGRNATTGYIINDGAGSFTVSFSTDGAVFGDEHTVKANEKLKFERMSVDSIRITWVSDSAYRASVV